MVLVSYMLIILVCQCRYPIGKRLHVATGLFMSDIDLLKGVQQASCHDSLPRMAKLFELSFPQEVTPLPLPALRLVFHFPLTHTSVLRWTAKA